ncbi:MAG: hypothetical protein HKP55_04345 [Gammaproteobacteria bacterium]|nr:hypothetical protein [Gammaproteobacteria bacterium]
MPITVFLKVALLSILFSTTSVSAKQWSEEFNFFLMEIDRQVLEPNDIELKSISHNFPSHLAVLMGEKLKEQDRYVKADSSLEQGRKRLMADIKPWFSMITKSIGNIEPFTGKRVTEDSLAKVFNDAYKGKFDRYVKSDYGFIDFPKGKSVYAMATKFRSRKKQDAGPERQWALFEQEDEPKEISLLGVGASKDLNTANGAYNAGVDAWNAAVKLWYAGNAGASRQKTEEAQQYFDLANEMGVVIVLEGWDFHEADNFMKYPPGPCHSNRAINCKNESKSKALMSYRGK